LAKLLESVRYNLARLADPSGRESLGRFWPYAILVGLLYFAAGMLAAIPALSRTMTNAMEIVVEAQKQGRDGAAQIRPFDPRLIPDMGSMAIPSAIILVLTAALLFGAVARRLHDRGRTGLWGLMPLPFYAFGLALLPRLFEGIRSGNPPNPRVFTALMLNNMLSLAALALLIMLLAGKGSEGPNRFGPPPEA
jgi:uncharacterized membrane protein YhaH (DUF805 family)